MLRCVFLLWHVTGGIECRIYGMQTLRDLLSVILPDFLQCVSPSVDENSHVMNAL